MRRVGGFVVLLALLPVAALAEERTPRGEFFGGYSYFGADLGGAGLNLNGFNFAMTENVNSWFGATVDFSSHYGNMVTLVPTTPPAASGGSTTTSVNAASVMLGPVFSYRKSPGVTPFVHVLMGAVRGSEGYLGISKSDSELGLAFGGGLDVKVTRNLAVRVVQADYITTKFNEVRQSNLRVSAGLVLRFSFK